MFENIKESFYKKQGLALAEKFISSYEKQDDEKIIEHFYTLENYAKTQYFKNVLEGFKLYKSRDRNDFLSELICDSRKKVNDEQLVSFIKIIGPEALFKKNQSDNYPIIWAMFERETHFLQLMEDNNINLDFSLMNLPFKKGLEALAIAVSYNKQKFIDELFAKDPEMFKKPILDELSYTGFTLLKEQASLLEDAFFNKNLNFNSCEELTHDEGVLCLFSYEEKEMSINIRNVLKKIINKGLYNIEPTDEICAMLGNFKNYGNFELLEPIINNFNEKENMYIMMNSIYHGNANVFAHMTSLCEIKESNLYELLNLLIKNKENNFETIELFYDFCKNRFDFFDINQKFKDGNTLPMELCKANEFLDKKIIDVFKKHNLDISLSNNDNKDIFYYMTDKVKEYAEVVFIKEIVEKERKVLEKEFELGIESTKSIPNKRRL